MAHYRKIDVRIWNDEKFRALSDDGQLLFLFLLTHPNLTALGAMRATRAGLAEERRWPLSRLNRALGAMPTTMVQFDTRACFLWLPNFLTYNPPDNANVVKSWPKALDLLPECDLRRLMLQRAGLHCAASETKGVAEAFASTFGYDPAQNPIRFMTPSPIPSGNGSGNGLGNGSGNGSGNGMPNQEQEQEQEQENPPPPSPRVASRGATLIPRRQPWLVHESGIGVGVPEWLHIELRQRLENLGRDDADAYLRHWYHRVEMAWQGRDPGSDAKRFWRERFDEDLAPKKASDGPKGLAARRAWTCASCGVIHEGTREQQQAGWCPAKAVTA